MGDLSGSPDDLRHLSKLASIRQTESMVRRLRDAIERTGKKQTQIAQAIGMPPATLSDLLKGRELKLSVASKLADVCGVSLDWLASGNDNGKNSPTSQGCVSVPLFEGEVSAGSGALAPNVENFATIEIGRMSLPDQVLSRLSNLVAVTVRGDSMYPTLADGDTVFIDTGDHAVITGSVYVMRRDTDLLIKRLSWNMSGDLVVSSDNSQYKDEQISADRARQLFEQGASPIVVVGRVVWRMGTIGGR